jgi:hypothetical protein
VRRADPRHAGFREGRTTWRLFDGFTETLNGSLPELPGRTQGLHGLIDAACGLAVANAYRMADAKARVGMAV